MNTDEIKNLSIFDMSNTKYLMVGYESRSIPEATPENMEVMMDKINELVETVNKLTRINK